MNVSDIRWSLERERIFCAARLYLRVNLPNLDGLENQETLKPQIIHFLSEADQIGENPLVTLFRAFQLMPGEAATYVYNHYLLRLREFLGEAEGMEPLNADDFVAADARGVRAFQDLVYDHCIGAVQYSLKGLNDRFKPRHFLQKIETGEFENLTLMIPMFYGIQSAYVTKTVQDLNFLNFFLPGNFDPSDLEGLKVIRAELIELERHITQVKADNNLPDDDRNVAEFTEAALRTVLNIIGPQVSEPGFEAENVRVLGF